MNGVKDNHFFSLNMKKYLAEQWQHLLCQSLTLPVCILLI